MENFATYRLTQTGPETQAILDQVNENTTDIAQLRALYEALTQSEPVIIQPSDTWPVADPEENVIYRVIDRVNTPPESYSDYMWNGTAMVLMATYDNAIDSTPTAGSNNPVASGGVLDYVSTNGSAYDISAAHSGTAYEDLAAALGTDGANVPSSVRKGGMSVRFVHTSDNKYVQWRYVGTSITDADFVNVANWNEDSGEVWVENPEWLRVVTDKDGRVLAGIKADGSVDWNIGIPKPVKTLFNKKVDKEEGKSLIDTGVSESMVVIEDRENRKELHIDSENNIVSYRDEQGILHEMVGISSNGIYIKGRDVAKDMKKIEEQENYNTNAIEDINQDIQDIRTILYNSPYNKRHAYGVVPDIIYLGNTERDYSWGDRDTTTAQVLSQFDTLVDNDYVTSEIIGYGTDGQPIKVYKFNPPTIQSPTNYIKGVPTVMITCGTHGFEKNSAYGWFYLMKDIIENGNSNELLRYFKRNVRFYIVPVVCSSAWDSNSYYNSNDVNINLNYSNGWKQQEHSGTAPFDQPESAAIRDFILAHKSEIDFFIDNHTTGGIAVSDNKHINWCDSTGCGNESDVYYNTIKNVIYTHTLNITNIINELFPNNLKQDESKNCSYITYNKTPYEGWTDAYAISQDIIGMCFEVCPGFPVNDTAYSSLSKRAITIMQASIIGHFCSYYSKII